MKKFIEVLMLLAAVFATIFTTPAAAPAQEEAFIGFYGGVEAGRQNIVGGSLVDGVDVLTQDTRTVLGVHGGWRYQFGFGLVIGAEASLGRTDGDLQLSDSANELVINYQNSAQNTLGLLGGFTLGAKKSWLLFGYIGEATRKFEVSIERRGRKFQQQDEQGMLRYGAGVEKRLIRYLHLRASAGTGRADFGDRQTNIEVEKKLEIAIGALVQF